MAAPKLRDHYDWVVLGDHPGALLSACLAARLGVSVLILPLGPVCPPTVSSRSGIVLDSETNVLTGVRFASSDGASSAASGAGDSGLLLFCLSQLGILPAETALFRPLSSIAQLLTPDLRMEMTGPSSNEFGFELRRELGDEVSSRLGLDSVLSVFAPAAERFWTRLPQRLTWQQPGQSAEKASNSAKAEKSEPKNLAQLRKTAARELASVESSKHWLSREVPVSNLAAELGSPELEAFGVGLWYASSLEYRRDPLSTDLIHLLSIAKSSSAFVGGLSQYRGFLIRLAKRLGADAPARTDCKRIFVENGRFVGVQPSQHGGMIGASGGVLGCALDHALPTMTSSGRSGVRKFKPSPKPVGWRFTLALSLHEEAIPLGVTSRMIWQEREAPPLEIEIVDPSDFGQRARGEKTIFLRSVMPFAQETLNKEYQRMLGARMLRKFTEILPFSEYHITQVYPDIRPFPCPELDEVYPFESLDAIPEALRCFDGAGVGGSSGIEGLFVASQEAYPECGPLGPIIAAVESVAWIAHRSGLPGPFA